MYNMYHNMGKVNKIYKRNNIYRQADITYLENNLLLASSFKAQNITN